MVALHFRQPNEELPPPTGKVCVFRASPELGLDFHSRSFPNALSNLGRGSVNLLQVRMRKRACFQKVLSMMVSNWTLLIR